MKKHIIAAAVVSAFAAPAMAQNVSVYGVIDAGYATSDIAHGAAVKTKQKAIGGIHSANGTGTLSGSRLGFRGTEDLGGGLKVGFVYETGINYSNGQAATTTPVANDANIGGNAAGFANVRQGFLELAGGFGGLRVGTQNTLAKDTSEAVDPLGGVTLTGAASVYQAGLVTRRDTITYQTPNFSGVTARAQFYLGETSTSDTVSEDNKGSALSISYAAGPLMLGAVAERIKNQTYAADGNRLVNLSSGWVTIFNTATATTIDKVEYNAFGGTYDFGAAKVHAMMSELKIKDATVADNGEIEGQLVGVTLPISSNVKLFGSYTTGKIKSQTVTTYDVDAFQLVAQYDLSKRTNAYVAAGQTKFDSPTANSDVKIKQMGVGIRHSF